MVIDYHALVAHAPSRERQDVESFLDVELPPVWAESYKRQTNRATDLRCVTFGTFDFFYDFCGEADGADPKNDVSRLVGALGWSNPAKVKRPKARMQGWLKARKPDDIQLFGNRDRGHFIAQSILGTSEDVEANLFVQDRTFNQGRSPQGKLYREMERFCAKNPGTFCFSRPHYANATDRPSSIDFGLVKPDGALWVETFDNSLALVD